MKIYLIQPPIEDFYTTPIRNIPHGLLSLAANLDGHESKLLDLRFGKQQQIKIPEELQPVGKFYRQDDASPFGLYKKYCRFGLSVAEMRRAIPGDGDIYLISSLFTTYAAQVYEVIEVVRDKVPEAIIIVGGAHATILAEEVLKHGADYVIRGEGEVALPRLLTEFAKAQPDYGSIENLSWCSGNGQICHNPINFIGNLNALPFADYQTAGTPPYTFSRKPHCMLITSRGCPHHCAFCCIHQTMGTRYRMRSVENVLAEMTEKIEQGFRSFDFEDDHLGGDRKWFLALLKGINIRFAGLDLSLQAMNGITAANLDSEILSAMWTAGFRSLNLALVTPSESRQKNIRRPFGTDTYLKIVESAADFGFFITSYLIIGLPGDPATDLLKSILFLAPLPTLIGPALFYLIPGTSTFRYLENLKQVPASPLCFRSSFYPVDNADCSRSAAMTLFRICRILNFMRMVIDSDPKPSFSISHEKIGIEGVINGRERQLNLGLGLLQLLFRRGEIYGTRRPENDHYPVMKEESDPQLIRLFLENDWQIRGLRKSSVMNKAEFVTRYLNI